MCINRLAVKHLIYSLCCMLILLLFVGCQRGPTNTVSNGSYQVTDGKGTIVSFSKKPQRILTLAMNTDSIVLSMVPTSHLVAVQKLMDDPSSSNLVEKGRKIRTKIKNPGVEQIIGLKPDLVIASSWSDINIVESLRDFGINVLVCPDAITLADIQSTIRLIAKALGEMEKGEQVIEKMDAKLAEIAAKIEKIPTEQRKTVVLISLMAAYGGSGCTFDTMCHYAGVINGTAAAGIKNGQILGKERLVKINPDVLIMPVYSDHGKFDFEAYKKTFVNDPSLQTLTAIQEKNLYLPRGGYIYNGSQDFVFGVQEIAYAAYGSAFRQPLNCHISVVNE